MRQVHSPCNPHVVPEGQHRDAHVPDGKTKATRRWTLTRVSPSRSGSRAPHPAAWQVPQNHGPLSPGARGVAGGSAGGRHSRPAPSPLPAVQASVPWPPAAACTLPPPPATACVSDVTETLLSPAARASPRRALQHALPGGAAAPPTAPPPGPPATPATPAQVSGCGSAWWLALASPPAAHRVHCLRRHRENPPATHPGDGDAHHTALGHHLLGGWNRRMPPDVGSWRCGGHPVPGPSVAGGVLTGGRVCLLGNHSGVVLSINSREMHSYLVS